MNNYDRYIRIVQFALRRYSVNGVITSIRKGEYTKFSQIEQLAAEKYLGFSKRKPR